MAAAAAAGSTDPGLLVEMQPKRSENLQAPLMAARPGLDDDRALDFNSTPLFSIFAGCLCLPFTLCQSWLVLNEGEQKIILNTGRPVAEIREPGIYFFNCCQREIRTVSTKKKCMEINNCKVADRDGNPIMVSSVLVLQVLEPRRVLLGVQNWESYAKQQGMTVLRQIVSRYAYEGRDGAPSLRSDTQHINDQLASALAQSLAPAGIRVLSFRLDEISFSPEVASLMLKRQAAQAVVEARKVIVEGAVELTHGAITALAERGVRLSKEQTSRMVSNLLPVLCSIETEG